MRASVIAGAIDLASPSNETRETVLRVLRLQVKNFDEAWSVDKREAVAELREQARHALREAEADRLDNDDWRRLAEAIGAPS